MKKALIIGIDYYSNIDGLSGCVNDANQLAILLGRNEDGSKNFECKTIFASDEGSKISKRTLSEEIRQLFEGDEESAILYFSGHGGTMDGEMFLATSEFTEYDDGYRVQDLI